MKITREVDNFKPITIVLETEAEAVLFRLIDNNRIDVAELLVKAQDENLDSKKIKDLMEESGIWAFMDSHGIDSCMYYKHFGKEEKP